MLFNSFTIHASTNFSHDEFRVSCDWARAAFSNNGDHVSVGSSDGSVFIFDAASAKVEKILKEHR
jgi:autophagy-related protein 16-1